MEKQKIKNMKKQTLIEKAKSLNQAPLTNKNISKEDVGLCVAWAVGEIKTSQVQKVKEHKNMMSTYHYLLNGLRQHIINTHK